MYKKLLALWVVLALTAGFVHTAGADETENIIMKAQPISTGSFVGERKHEVSGEAKLIKNGEVYYVVLADNFKFDNAPDPRIGFTKNGKFDKSTIFTALNVFSGEQLYRVPANIDPTKYDTVQLWCNKAGVPLGHASLN